MIIFKGDTREVRWKIEQNGVQIDPATLTEAKVWVYEYVSGTVIGKWSTTVETGFETMTITDDDKLLFVITETQSSSGTVTFANSARGVELIIQCSYKYADVHSPSGYHRITKKGQLGYLKYAETA